jgi:hypothetical protein
MIDDNNVFKIEIIYLHFANNWAGRCKTRAGAEGCSARPP